MKQEKISPLRARMIEDMRIRGLGVHRILRHQMSCASISFT